MSQPEFLIASRFYLELSISNSQYAVDGVFMDCKGFKCSQEVIEVCEVTPNKWGKQNKGMVVRTKIPGNVKTSNLVLRRGLTSSTALWQWFDDIQSGNWFKQRRDGSLTIYDQASEVQARFQFFRAWPTNYSIADVSATSTDIEIEELELACEEFKRIQ